jgi:DNA-binding transcriptional ArsR family regulator
MPGGVALSTAVDGQTAAAQPARGKPRGQKADLFRWVNDQQQLDMRTKFILKELASFADSDCCAWSKVDDLAYAANCSPRTVQYHLAALLEAGLMRRPGGCTGSTTAPARCRSTSWRRASRASACRSDRARPWVGVWVQKLHP